MRNRALLYVKIALGVIAVSIVLGYTYYRTRDLVGGPVITIDSPVNGASLDTPTVIISGHAERITSISLNDRPIFISKKGEILEGLLLVPGYNIFELRAQDRFGRSISKVLQLVYRAPAASTSPTTLVPDAASTTIPTSSSTTETLATSTATETLPTY